LLHIDHDPNRPRLTVGPYAIALPEAAHGASVLIVELWAAIKTDDGEPVSRQAIAALLR
jgi:hypothetical protein